LQSRVRNLLLFATVVLATITAAQFSSFLVNTRIPENTTVEISSILHLTHIRNHGGVFGMLQGSGWVFAGISFLLLLAVLGYLCKAEQVARYEYLCFGFITGGGASNILDRFIYGSVVDFIDVQHIPFWHYVFNTADVFIHIGIWPLLLIGLFFHPPDKKRIA
jgi:signal peptidase II